VITLADTSGINTISPKAVGHPVIKSDVSGSALTDTSRLNIDSVKAATHPVIKSYHSVVDSLLSSGKFINVKDLVIYFIVE
jgi:hypothetical protein